jgi:hypothetical protein
LLRIFDPLEMYGVIETLQRNVAQLQAEKAEYLSNQTNSPESPQQPDWQIQPQHPVPKENLNTLISLLESRIEHLIKNPNLSTELQQMYLNLAITDIDKMRHCHRSST